MRFFARSFKFLLALSTSLLLIWSPANALALKSFDEGQVSLRVTATAYNSLPGQTSGNPNIGAWGDRIDQLEPGQRAIAVSQDLLKKGLTRGQRVRIAGFKDEFVVLDRTAKRWSNRIDIHMGKDRKRALRWGKRRVLISWNQH